MAAIADQILGTRRNRFAVIGAIFQVINHLCFAFVIVAAIRTPTLTEKALDRAALVDRLQRLSSRLEEAQSTMDWLKVAVGVGARDEVRRKLESWQRRIDGAESAVVETLNFDVAKQNGWLPNADNVREMTMARTDEDAHKRLMDCEARLVGAMSEFVAKKVGEQNPQWLRKKSKDAIALRAGSCLLAAIDQEYRAQAAAVTAAAKDIVNWTDLKHTLPDEQQKAAEQYKDAYSKYEQVVRGRLPQAQALYYRAEGAGLRAKAEQFLEETIAAAFNGSVGALVQEDMQQALAIRQQENAQILEVNHIYTLPDIGEAHVADRLCELAKVLQEKWRRGPRTNAALKEVQKKVFERDKNRLSAEIVEHLKNCTWEKVRVKGVAIGYDDGWPIEADKKEKEIVQHLPAAADLPTGSPMDNALRADVEDVIRKLSRAMLDAEVASIRGAAGKAAPQYGADWIDEIAKETSKFGKDIIALLKQQKRAEATLKIRGRFWEEHGARHPTPEHDGLADQRAHVICDKSADAYWTMVGKATPRPSQLETLRQMNLSDLKGESKQQRLESIIDELVRPRPEMERNNPDLRKQFVPEAESSYDARIAALRDEFQQKARQALKAHVEKLRPSDWGKDTSDEELRKRLLQEVSEDSVLRELLPPAK